MSAAKPMGTEKRASNYAAQSAALTPRQGRRIRHKEHEQMARVQNDVRVGRLARLRRRFDRKDNQRIAREAAQVAAHVRSLRHSARPHGRRDDRVERKADYERRVGIRRGFHTQRTGESQ